MTRQFNTAAFSGPQPGSLGLESGLNYMRGCPDRTFDFAIARNIHLGGNRQLQLRAELYNAFNAVIINGAQHDDEHREPGDRVGGDEPAV